MTRHTIGEYLMIGIIASAVQFLGRYIFSQIVAFPPMAIFFGFQPATARPATP